MTSDVASSPEFHRAEAMEQPAWAPVQSGRAARGEGGQGGDLMRLSDHARLAGAGGARGGAWNFLKRIAYQGFSDQSSPERMYREVHPRFPVTK